MLRGRPLAVEVVREHDQDGRVVRERQVGEAAWLDSDRALLLALTELERALCPCGCGQPRELAWNPDSAGWWGVGHIRCYAGEAKAEYAKANKLTDADLTVVRYTLPDDRELLPLDINALLGFDDDDVPPDDD